MFDDMELTEACRAVLDGWYEGNEEFQALGWEERPENLEFIKLSEFEEALPCPEAGEGVVEKYLDY